MTIDTTRFGRVNYKKSEIVWMDRSILGFDDYKKFVIVHPESQEPFKWLQSLDSPSLAFLIIDPLYFKPDYTVEVNPKDISLLGAKDKRDFSVFVLVSIPSGEPQKMSANLRGPLVVNKDNMHAAQLVLGESNYDTEYFIFKEIEQRLAKAEA